MTSKQGYGTSSDHEQPFYHVLPSISSLQSYEPETCMCMDMTLTSYLITGKDLYLFKSSVKFVFLVIIFFYQLEKAGGHMERLQ